jgi:hypothetical protein
MTGSESRGYEPLIPPSLASQTAKNSCSRLPELVWRSWKRRALARQLLEGHLPSGWCGRLLVVRCTVRYRRQGGHNSLLPALRGSRSGVD